MYESHPTFVLQNIYTRNNVEIKISNIIEINPG
jgi:hypothetical protein